MFGKCDKNLLAFKKIRAAKASELKKMLKSEDQRLRKKMQDKGLKGISNLDDSDPPLSSDSEDESVSSFADDFNDQIVTNPTVIEFPQFT